MDDGKYRFNPKISFLLIQSGQLHDDLSERERWIIKYVENNGAIVRSTIEKYLKISPTLSKKLLKSLADKGLIHQTGRGKSTQYVPATDA